MKSGTIMGFLLGAGAMAGLIAVAKKTNVVQRVKDEYNKIMAEEEAQEVIDTFKKRSKEMEDNFSEFIKTHGMCEQCRGEQEEASEKEASAETPEEETLEYEELSDNSDDE